MRRRQRRRRRMRRRRRLRAERNETLTRNRTPPTKPPSPPSHNQTTHKAHCRTHKHTHSHTASMNAQRRRRRARTNEKPPARLVSPRPNAPSALSSSRAHPFRQRRHCERTRARALTYDEHLSPPSPPSPLFRQETPQARSARNGSDEYVYVVCTRNDGVGWLIVNGGGESSRQPEWWVTWDASITEDAGRFSDSAALAHVHTNTRDAAQHQAP